MTYAINPNAKNVWIRDNEDTMDLSPITDASSVYLENGRTLEQELGEGSMVSNVVTVDNSMSKVIDGTLDGAYESCVLKGRTLVNCVEQSMFKPMYTSRVETEGGFVYTQTEYQVATRLQFDYTQYSLLNNNTYYLISFELKVNKARILNITTDGTGYEGYGLQIEENTHTLIRQKIKFSPNGTVLRIYVRCKDGIDYTNDTFTLKNLMLIPYQDGMENWDIPYFEGICDVKMPILRNVGKNLFDINGDINQKFSYMAGGSGNVILGANSFRADSYSYDHHGKGVILNLKPNTTYTISGHVENFGNVNFMTGGWNPRHRIVKANGYFKTTYTPADGEVETCLSFVTFSNSSDPKAIFSDIQLEESSTATPYEPYKSNTVSTSEEIVLRSLPNGVQDTYNLLTGEYVKRIGEVVLDGSEDWSLSNNLSEVRKCYVTALTNVKVAESNSVTTINNRMSSITYNLAIKDKQLGIFARTSTNGLAIVIDIENLIEFKTYLQQNPITVQYELATPITTTVKSSGIPFAYENGHVILESGYEGQSLLPTLEYSTVVNKTGQIQSVTKTIVKQETQITELEKMLIQGIIEMDYNNTLLTLNLEIDEVM